MAGNAPDSATRSPVYLVGYLVGRDGRGIEHPPALRDASNLAA